MNLNDTITNIHLWAEDRKITVNGTVHSQVLKLMSEVGELADNVNKGNDVKDDIGDVFVTLLNVATLSGTTIEECASIAYEEIKDREGFLNKNGTFIKSTDANYAQLLAEASDDILFDYSSVELQFDYALFTFIVLMKFKSAVYFKEYDIVSSTDDVHKELRQYEYVADLLKGGWNVQS